MSGSFFEISQALHQATDGIDILLAGYTKLKVRILPKLKQLSIFSIVDDLSRTVVRRQIRMLSLS
jgi:hypothetical protein